MEKILSHAINYDKSYWQNDGEGLRIHMSSPPNNPKKNKEKLAEIVFEKFNANGFFVTNSSILALNSNGRNTGFVLDCGHDVTNLVLSYEGFVTE